MSLQSNEKVINGRRFIVPQLPAMAALKLMARLGRVVGPALGTLTAGLEATVDLGKAAGLLFQQLTESETEGLINALCANVLMIDGNAQRPMMKAFDVDFAGERLVDVLEVLRFVLEVQYGPTFAAMLAARAATQVAATPAASA